MTNFLMNSGGLCGGAASLVNFANNKYPDNEKAGLRRLFHFSGSLLILRPDYS